MITTSKQTLQCALGALGIYSAFFGKSVAQTIRNKRYKSLKTQC